MVIKKSLEINQYWVKYYLLQLKAVLEPGSRFGHEARRIHTAVPQAAALGEMSLEFFPVSSVQECRCEEKERDCNITTKIGRSNL